MRISLTTTTTPSTTTFWQTQIQSRKKAQTLLPEVHSEVTELAALTARAGLQLAKQDALSDVLTENGFKLRQLISRDAAA
jgi:hypothetical protein